MGRNQGLTKWKGVERLVHDLGLHEWDHGNDGFGGEWVADEKKLAKLRERIEPLLLALYAETCTDDKCGHGNCDEIRRLLDTWR